MLDEIPIHDVDMQGTGANFYHFLAFLEQKGKISRENRRADYTFPQLHPDYYYRSHGAQQDLTYNISQNMGNNVNSKLMASAISPLNWKDMPAEAKEKFIVREILTHSEDQHRQLLITLSRFKQYDSRNIVKLVDSHTVQSNNLCSIMNYIYAVLEKPRHSFSNYMAAKKASSDQVLRIIADVVKAISFLKKEDNDIDRIKEEMIFIEEEEGGEITAKIMNPFFKDSGYEGEQAKGPIVDLGNIFKKYIDPTVHSQEIVEFITRMARGGCSIDQLQSRFSSDGKKSKQGLKLVKKAAKNHVQRYSKTTRIERESITSNGSSLMIDADGDRSELIFKDFYENGQDSTSIWQLQSQQNATTHYQQEYSHEFPKRYTKIGTCRKSQRSQTSSASERPLQCDFSSLLSSAKLAQSFIGP